MKRTNKFQKFLCIVLAVVMLIPGYLPDLIHATNDTDNTSSISNQVTEPNTNSEQTVSTNDTTSTNDSNTESTDTTASVSGFNISIEWADGEFKNGTAYNIIEDTNTNNTVKLRVSYSNNQVSGTGYQPGELVITVKGIGAINRDGCIEADVGADKATATTKTRDWTYTWNKTQDVYTFTNNNTIAPNTVLSGYFDMVWTINSKKSIHQYSQDDIAAELLLPTGSSAQTKPLSITNTTTCDTYTASIDKMPLYSGTGISGDLEEPGKYVFVKYSLASNLVNKSRGVKTTETFIFNPDSTSIGEGGIITYANIPYNLRNDGTYYVSLKNNQSVGSQYVIVAYDKETYVGQPTTATITSYGTYNEGDNEGNLNQVQLATAFIDFAMPADFEFVDHGGDVHESKESYYEWLMAEDNNFKNKVSKNGGHLSGQNMLLGTTETFYMNLLSDFPTASGSHRTFELIDDFIYITQNDTNYRKLTEKDYEMKEVIIGSTNGIPNENGFPIQAGKYPVKVYAIQAGESFAITEDSGPYNDETNLVWEGLWQNYDQTVKLPEGTISVLVRFENVPEATFVNEYSVKNFKYHTKNHMVAVKIYFKLDEEGLSEEEKANLSEGQLVNTMYYNLYDTDHII